MDTIFDVDTHIFFFDPFFPLVSLLFLPTAMMISEKEGVPRASYLCTCA